MLSDNWCALRLLYSPAAHSDNKLSTGKAGPSTDGSRTQNWHDVPGKGRSLWASRRCWERFIVAKTLPAARSEARAHCLGWSEAAGWMKGVGGLNWGRGERERARVETEREDSMTFVSVATQPRINMPRLARRTSGTSDSVIVKLSELHLKPSAKLIRSEKGAEDKTETRNWSK